MNAAHRYEIRPMEDEHLDSVAQVLAAAPRPRRCVSDPAIAKRFLATSLREDGRSNLVALCGDQVVGYTCALRARGPVAGCGPLALHPDHASADLTARLLMKSVVAASEYQVGLLRLPLALHKSMFNIVYRGMKLEFTGDTFIRFERRAGDPVPNAAEHDVQPLDRDGVERVVAFARERFGDMDRGRDLRVAIERLDARGWALERAGELRGFVLNIPGMGIGPLVAADPGSAIDALRAATAFDQERGAPSHVQINAVDRDLIAEALRLGYVCREPVLLFERSFGGTRPRRPRGPRCLGRFGVP